MKGLRQEEPTHVSLKRIARRTKRLTIRNITFSGLSAKCNLKISSTTEEIFGQADNENYLKYDPLSVNTV